VVVGFTTTCAISAVVSSNPAHGMVYFIQHYVIKFATSQWFFPGNPDSSNNKTEMLLKVVLNNTTIILILEKK
jgi:hypothetical protein